MSDAIRARLRSRIDELGKKDRAVSLAAGMSADAVRSIFRNRDSSPTVETLTKLAGPLETTPEWLAFGVDDEDVALARAETAERTPFQLPVIGEVAAGRWLEVDDFVDEPAFAPVTITPDQRWPVEHQYGLVVRGESLNRFAIDGDVLACVDAAATRYIPRAGNLIIVEMRRAAGLLRQRTAKRFLPRETHVELWPDSDHPRWQKPIIIPKALTPLEYALEDEDGRIDVTVSAFVLSAVRPVQRWRPPPAAALVEAGE